VGTLLLAVGCAIDASPPSVEVTSGVTPDMAPGGGTGSSSGTKYDGGPLPCPPFCGLPGPFPVEQAASVRVEGATAP
jgi:hypothetical protein